MTHDTPYREPNEAVVLERTVGYTFQDKRLLVEALTHRTFVHENPGSAVGDNQRLEFLGDAVLGLVVGDLLMRLYPDCREGELTQMRSNLVNETRLAAIARQVGMGENLRLGRGELQSDGQNKSSILADALEALFAAVYLDGGFKAAFNVVQELFETVMGAASFDPKSELQELAQKMFKITPTYHLLSEAGPDHDKVFTVELSLARIRVQGSGKSKKQAEKMAALRALSELSKE